MSNTPPTVWDESYASLREQYSDDERIRRRLKRGVRAATGGAVCVEVETGELVRGGDKRPAGSGKHSATPKLSLTQ